MQCRCAVMLRRMTSAHLFTILVLQQMQQLVLEPVAC